MNSRPDPIQDIERLDCRLGRQVGAAHPLHLGGGLHVAVAIVRIGDGLHLEVQSGFGLLAIRFGGETGEIVVRFIDPLGIRVESALVAVQIVAEAPPESGSLVPASRISHRIRTTNGLAAETTGHGVLQRLGPTVQDVVFVGHQVAGGVLLRDLVPVAVVERARNAHCRGRADPRRFVDSHELVQLVVAVQRGEIRAVRLGDPDNVVVRIVGIGGGVTFGVSRADLTVTSVVLIAHVEHATVIPSVLHSQHIADVVVCGPRYRRYRRAGAIRRSDQPVGGVVAVLRPVALPVEERCLVPFAVVLVGLKDRFGNTVPARHVESGALLLDKALQRVELRNRHDATAVGFARPILPVEILHAERALELAVCVELPRCHEPINGVVVVFRPLALLVHDRSLVHAVVLVDEQAGRKWPGPTRLIGGVQIGVVNEPRPVQPITVDNCHVAVGVRLCHFRARIVVRVGHQPQWSTAVADGLVDLLHEQSVQIVKSAGEDDSALVFVLDEVVVAVVHEFIGDWVSRITRRTDIGGANLPVQAVVVEGDVDIVALRILYRLQVAVAVVRHRGGELKTVDIDDGLHDPIQTILGGPRPDASRIRNNEDIVAVQVFVLRFVHSRPKPWPAQRHGLPDPGRPIPAIVVGVFRHETAAQIAFACLVARGVVLIRERNTGRVGLLRQAVDVVESVGRGLAVRIRLANDMAHPIVGRPRDRAGKRQIGLHQSVETVVHVAGLVSMEVGLSEHVAHQIVGGARDDEPVGTERPMHRRLLGTVERIIGLDPTHNTWIRVDCDVAGAVIREEPREINGGAVGLHDALLHLRDLSIEPVVLVPGDLPQAVDHRLHFAIRLITVGRALRRTLFAEVIEPQLDNPSIQSVVGVLHVVGERVLGFRKPAPLVESTRRDIPERVLSRVPVAIGVVVIFRYEAPGIGDGDSIDA